MGTGPGSPRWARRTPGRAEEDAREPAGPLQVTGLGEPEHEAAEERLGHALRGGQQPGCGVGRGGRGTRAL